MYIFTVKKKDKLTTTKMLENRLDDLDHQILKLLISNSRLPYTDIAKELVVSAGTIHVRVRKMEDMRVIKGATLILDYDKLGYSFVGLVGLFINKTISFPLIIEEIKKINEVTVAHLTTGKFAIFCKIRAKNTSHMKQIIFNLDNIKGVIRTESSISLEEVVSNDLRLMTLSKEK